MVEQFSPADAAAAVQGVWFRRGGSRRVPASEYFPEHW